MADALADWAQFTFTVILTFFIVKVGQQFVDRRAAVDLFSKTILNAMNDLRQIREPLIQSSKLPEEKDAR